MAKTSSKQPIKVACSPTEHMFTHIDMTVMYYPDSELGAGFNTPGGRRVVLYCVKCGSLREIR